MTNDHDIRETQGLAYYRDNASMALDAIRVAKMPVCGDFKCLLLLNLSRLLRLLSVPSSSLHRDHEI